MKIPVSDYEPECDDDGSPHLGLVHVECHLSCGSPMPAYSTAEYIEKHTMHSSLDSFIVFM